MFLLARHSLMIFSLFMVCFPVYAAKTTAIVGYTAWQSAVDSSVKLANTDSLSLELEKEFMMGPTVVLREGRYIAGARKSSADFDTKIDSNALVIVDSNGSALTGTHFNFEHQEYDLYLGYEINSVLALLAGQREYEFSSFEPQTSGEILYSGKTHLFKGKFYSMNLHTGLLRSDHTMYYLTYTQMKLNEEGADIFGDAEGKSYEVGGVYFPARTRYLYTVSYKRQEYTFDKGHSSKFAGFGFGIEIIF